MHSPSKIFLSMLIFTIFLQIIFVAVYSTSTENSDLEILDTGDSEFFWPLPR